MATIGTYLPGITAPSTGDLTITAPQTSRNEGFELFARKRAVRVKQGEAKLVGWELRLPDGKVADLSSNTSDLVQTKILEALSIGTSATPITITGAISVANEGRVGIQLTTESVAYPGIFLFETALLDSTGTSIRFIDSGYLIVERSLFGEPCPGGFPSVSEIRLRLRDSCPEDNFLLINTEFDDAEIADAVVQTVQMWNELPPPIRLKYNTVTFPYPRQCFIGVVGHLYRTAAAHYRREQVDYQAAGVAFDDKKKSAEYETIAERRLDEYKAWLKLQKSRISVEEGWGSVRSPYSLW